jgi:hypothetical protein
VFGRKDKPRRKTEISLAQSQQESGNLNYIYVKKVAKYYLIYIALFFSFNYCQGGLINELNFEVLGLTLLLIGSLLCYVLMTKIGLYTSLIGLLFLIPLSLKPWYLIFKIPNRFSTILNYNSGITILFIYFIITALTILMIYVTINRILQKNGNS